MTTQHIAAVNRKIAEVKGLKIDPIAMSAKSVSVLNTKNDAWVYRNWMESWSDAGPLLEEMAFEKGRFLVIDSENKEVRIYLGILKGCGEYELFGTFKAAICYTWLRLKGVAEPEKLGVE